MTDLRELIVMNSSRFRCTFRVALSVQRWIVSEDALVFHRPGMHVRRESGSPNEHSSSVRHDGDMYYQPKRADLQYQVRSCACTHHSECPWQSCPSMYCTSEFIVKISLKRIVTRSIVTERILTNGTHFLVITKLAEAYTIQNVEWAHVLNTVYTLCCRLWTLSENVAEVLSGIGPSESRWSGGLSMPSEKRNCVCNQVSCSSINDAA